MITTVLATDMFEIVISIECSKVGFLSKTRTKCVLSKPKMSRSMKMKAMASEQQNERDWLVSVGEGVIVSDSKNGMNECEPTWSVQCGHQTP